MDGAVPMAPGGAPHQTDLQVQWWPIEDILPYPGNPRKIGDQAVAKVAKSILDFGWRGVIAVDPDGVIIYGHTRLLAGISIRHPTAPVVMMHGLTPAQTMALRIADNRVAEESEWDNDLLNVELAKLAEMPGVDLGSTGFNSDELERLMALIDVPGTATGTNNGSGLTGAGSLAVRFGVPPFSVLNAREGWWQDRKRAWLALGIASEVGRAAVPRGGAGVWMGKDANGKSGTAIVYERGPALAYVGQGSLNAITGQGTLNGTSIFDPVLCELAYRWFCPPGGIIIDPFAGGSVRGLVASRLGRAYHGIDLRSEQVLAQR